METLQVWYDVACPYARIGVYWLRNVEAAGGLTYGLEWRNFQLDRVNLEPSADPEHLWANPDGTRSLLPSAALQWAAAKGPDVFEAVQRAFFDARHVRNRKIGRAEVARQVLESIGFGEAADAMKSDERWMKAVRADHEVAAAAGIYGVPTLVFPDAAPVHLRLLDIPEGRRAVDVFVRVEAVCREPLIHELKRPAT